MRCQPPEEFLLALAGQLVLPDAENPPAPGAERAGDESIANPVGGNFLPPKRRVGLRLRRVDRATVPKAAVDEEDDALASENKVRLADKRDATPPARDARRAQQPQQAKLRTLVAFATYA